MIIRKLIGKLTTDKKNVIFIYSYIHLLSLFFACFRNDLLLDYSKNKIDLSSSSNLDSTQFDCGIGYITKSKCTEFGLIVTSFSEVDIN